MGTPRHGRTGRIAGGLALALGLAALTGGCAARTAAPSAGAEQPRAASPPAPAWRFGVVAACELPSNRALAPSDPKRTGGLSGLLYEPDRATFLAVSDQDVPRLLRIQLDIDERGCRPSVLDTLVLRWPDGDVPARAARDFEDLTRWPGGDLLLANESDEGKRSESAPGLHRFTLDGQYVRSLDVPTRLWPRPGAGVRFNASLESVTISPDGDRLFAAVEQPLVQDDGAATLVRGGASRLIEYRREGDTYTLAREFALTLDPVPHPQDIVPRWADIGIVALTALDDGSLLMLERSFVAGTRDGARASRNDILISRLRLDHADDVSQVESLRDAPLVRPAEKERLASLRDFAPELPSWLGTLDNFEGMALGPRLPDGSQTLVLVSDDNFNPAQRTAFIVLRFQPGKAAGRARDDGGPHEELLDPHGTTRTPPR